MSKKIFFSLSLFICLFSIATTIQAANSISANKNGLGSMMGYSSIGNLIQLNNTQRNTINGIGSYTNDVDVNTSIGQITSQIMTSSRAKKVDRLCAKTAMLKFEDSIAEGWKAYSQSIADAFATRKTAVSSAWDSSSLTTGYRGVAKAYVDFNKQKRLANLAYNKAKMVSMKTWITETNACPLAGTNMTPTISITSPANGSTLASTSPISIVANASSYAGTAGIQKVSFFKGNTLISEDTSSPYSYDWTATATGTISFTASVLDKDGRRATSSEISITVN
jgi:hypothetical protein